MRWALFASFAGQCSMSAMAASPEGMHQYEYSKSDSLQIMTYCTYIDAYLKLLYVTDAFHVTLSETTIFGSHIDGNFGLNHVGLNQSTGGNSHHPFGA